MAAPGLRVTQHPNRGVSGSIPRAEPLISREIYEAVQARLALNVFHVRVNTSQLLRVLYCPCGAPMHVNMYTWGGKDYRYYRCAGRFKGNDCKAPALKAEKVEDAVFGAILGSAGRFELTERKMIPGRDYSEDVARLAETIGHLSTRVAVGRATRKDVSDDEAALQHAQDQLERIASLEPEPARVEPVRTGKTLRARWEELDVPGRNQFMQDVGVRAVAHKDHMPPLDMQPGPLVADAIPRTVIVDEDGLHAVIDLGNLRDMLARTDGVPSRTTRPGTATFP